MARIFISHSSANNAEAIALRDWLAGEGWDDVFLDLDPERGIVAGERWERALNEAANRCEAVLFLVSRAWLNSRWCLKELNLAHRLNKRLFGVLIEDIPIADLPPDLTSTWQLVNLAAGSDHQLFRAVTPDKAEEVHVTFSANGLTHLKGGLTKAGLDARFFAWPPAGEPNRPPYRGLKPLEAEDAGIFFGREAPVIEALDRLRGLAEAAPPRFLVFLGASGAGKSSFLRAGLLPRLSRDDRNFLPLPVIRPDRAVLTGETGLIRSLDAAFQAQKAHRARAEMKAAVEGGMPTLLSLLALLSLLGSLAESARPPSLPDMPAPKPPALVLSIDQGEELFLAEGAQEAEKFLALLKDVSMAAAPDVIILVTIRSDSYERLQMAKALEGVKQAAISLPPVPHGSYADIIEGPARRLRDTPRALKIEPALTQALLTDIEAGGAKDALPLLAFTLERLYVEYGGDGDLRLSEYEQLGRVKGSIEAAVERALTAADADRDIPKDRATRLAFLRRGLIPWLAGIDPDTGSPRRRVARLSQIPEDARPLVKLLVEQRLLATDVAKETGEPTIEPAHEALLRQWSLLQGWLTEDAGLLAVLEGVKRASRDWAVNNRSAAWLTHTTDRLEAAERLSARPDLSASLELTDREYISACRKAERIARGRKRRVQRLVYALLVGIIAGLIGWINQSYLKEEMNWFFVMRPYMVSQVRPYVLSPDAEQALKPGDSFRECAKDCPEMVVEPAGAFTMGSPPDEKGRYDNEGPRHKVTIARPFAVSKLEVTFADWDACVSVGGCPQEGRGGSDAGWGRDRRPAIYVSWDDAKAYVAWLSRMTGKTYRLLTEAEWEYAARAGTKTAYYWGNEIGKNNANCDGCGSQWDNKQTAPVGSFKSNAFGLYDMAGNVWQWVEDCYHDDYDGAPTNGSEWLASDCNNHVVRGGGWGSDPQLLRSANRLRDTASDRYDGLGFRVGRTLTARAGVITVAPGAH
jgi:formylglycine-generating enzyme required for sulfatase activity